MSISVRSCDSCAREHTMYYSISIKKVESNQNDVYKIVIHNNMLMSDVMRGTDAMDM